MFLFFFHLTLPVIVKYIHADSRESPAERPGGPIQQHEPRDLSLDAPPDAHHPHQDGVERQRRQNGQASQKVKKSVWLIVLLAWMGEIALVEMHAV